jgi:ATP-dependent DNA helicase RecG
MAKTKETGEKTRQKIIYLIKQNPSITREEMGEKLSVTVNGIDYHIKKLRTEKTIKRKGGRKTGEWKLL